MTGATYAPQGVLQGFTNGSSISGAMTYNSRLQPLQLYFTTGTISSATLDQLNLAPCPATTATIITRSYNFGLGANDNGNVLSVTNCRDANRTQNFTYDALNRMQTAYTTGPNWGESLGSSTSPGGVPATPGIDAWGNLWQRSPITGKTNYEPLNCPSNSKNQLSTCSMGYDAAGNMTSNGSATYTYDAENRLVSTGGWTYVYDGDGQRVKKCNACTTASGGTLYWRGGGSDVLVESDLGGTLVNEYVFFNGRRVAKRDAASQISYYFADHLGSTSVVTGSTGVIKDESDYYPYGGEIAYSNTLPQNYKFTGKERDSESGLLERGALL